MLKRLWSDEVGAVVGAEIVLVMTILVIGIIVGLASLRDAVVTELADVGGAIAALDQGYRVGGAVGHHAQTNASHFHDRRDACDDRACGQNPDGNSRCVRLCTAGGGECSDQG